MSTATRSFRGVRTAASKVLAVAVSLCLSVMCVPAVSFADDAVTGSVTTSDGWTLTYEYTEGGDEATITGTDGYTGTDGSLAIPDTVEADDGTELTVTALGDGAFEENTDVVSVTVPEGVETMGKRCFRKATSLESINIPSTLEYIPVNCFFNCTSLTSVEFADDMTLEYLGYQCFRGCSALEEITIPALSGGDTTSRYTAGSTTTAYYRVGGDAFRSCSSLQKVVFLAGGEGTTYFDSLNSSSNSSNGAFSSVGNSTYIVINYNRGSAPSTGDGMNSTALTNYYVTVNYYANAQAALNDTGNDQFVYQEVWQVGTVIYDIVYGETDAEPYETTGTKPELEEGSNWLVGESAMSDNTTTLSDGIVVYPGYGEGDLTGGWVEVEGSYVQATYDDQGTEQNAGTVVLLDEETGVPQFTGITVYYADGTEAEEGDYELVFQQKVSVKTQGATQWYYYYTVDPEDAWEEGTYAVYAVGTGEHADTTTAAEADDYNASDTGLIGQTEFTAQYYSLTTSVTSVTSSDASYLIGRVGLLSQASGTSEQSFVAVADANDWQACMLATWLAGVSGGQALFTDGEDTDSYVYSAIAGSDTSKVYIVGGEDAVGASVAARIKTVLSLDSGAISGIATGAASAEDAANAVYASMCKVAGTYGYEWGDTAVVMSSELCYDTLSIAEYVYGASAPVFFTDSDGDLSEETVENLADFANVVVVGPEECVSAAAEEAAGSYGASVERLLDDGEAAGAYAASLEESEFAAAELGLSGADSKGLLVVSSSEPALVASAAMLATAYDVPFLVVASSEDARAAAAYVVRNVVETVTLVGDFSEVDAALAAAGQDGTAELLAGAWGDGVDTALCAGDTYERHGVVYTVGEDGDEATGAIGAAELTRLGGSNRYVTAALEALAAYDSADTVVLATGQGYADALTASALAGALDAPVLLTKASALHEAAAEAIERLGAGEVVVVGGASAVSAAVVEELESMGLAVQRLAGANRYATAEAIYAYGLTAGEDGGSAWGDTVILATGANYADALSASSLAYAGRFPILLVRASGGLTEASRAYLSASGGSALILGGTSAVPESVATWLSGELGSGSVERLAGDNRYATSAAIAEWAVANDRLDWDGAALATGRDFPDALAGAAVAGASGSVMLLVADSDNGRTALELLAGASGAVSSAYVLGGTSAVGESLQAQAVEALCWRVHYSYEEVSAL